MATAVKPAPAYPRPRVTFQLQDLFQEPVYPDGPYDRGDEDEEDDDPGA